MGLKKEVILIFRDRSWRIASLYFGRSFALLCVKIVVLLLLVYEIKLYSSTQ